MPYPAKSVANAILEKARSNGENVTPLKLQKLLYYVCGYYLASAGRPLIDHTFEAWDYGPVVPHLYREFKKYGNSPITGLATDLDRETNAYIPVPKQSDDKRLDVVLNFVWAKFGGFTGPKLSAMTHAPDSPWDKTRKANPGIKDADIERDMLRQHFSQYIKKREAVKVGN